MSEREGGINPTPVLLALAIVLIATGCTTVSGDEVPSPSSTARQIEQIGATETLRAVSNWWETTTPENRNKVCSLHDRGAPNAAMRIILRSDTVEFDAEVGLTFLDGHCASNVPVPVETPSPAPEPTQEPTQEPQSEDLWERYGRLPDGYVEYLEDDYFLAFGPTDCANVSAGKIETGWLHGVLTGGNLPDYVKPQPAGVYTIVKSIELSCPDLMDEFTALLDAYDAAHAPYPY